MGRCTILTTTRSAGTTLFVAHEVSKSWPPKLRRNILATTSTAKFESPKKKSCTLLCRAFRGTKAASRKWGHCRNYAWLLSAICVQTGTVATVWIWQGWYSTILTANWETSENKSKDPFWTLIDFKDSAHVASERTRSYNC